MSDEQKLSERFESKLAAFFAAENDDPTAADGDHAFENLSDLLYKNGVRILEALRRDEDLALRERELAVWLDGQRQAYDDAHRAIRHERNARERAAESGSRPGGWRE